jgi:hypothetical protein
LLPNGQRAAFDPPVGHRIGERERDRRRRCIAVAIDRSDDFLGRDAKFVRRTVDDPLVRLVRDEPIDIGSRIAGGFEGVLDHVGDHRHGVPEYLPAFHAQMADRSCG